MYSIVYKNKAARFLETLEKETGRRLYNKIESLKEDPFPHGSLKISGSENQNRLRIGKYRALYEVYKERSLIYVIKIDTREGFYGNI